jgi:hypothetical protein
MQTRTIAWGCLLALLSLYYNAHCWAEPFAENVVEQQVQKETDKKKEAIADPARTEFSDSIKALTPAWIQDLILKERESFIRAKEKTPIRIVDHIALTDEERTAVQKSLKQYFKDLYSAQLKFSLATMHGKTFTETKAELTRIYFPDNGESFAQQFREKISLTAPEKLSQYTWLSFRFFRDPFDRVWIYTPQTKRSRPIAPQLRNESLFFSALGADDLLGFSGNTNRVEVTFGGAEIMLVPITYEFYSHSKVGSCAVYTAPERKTEQHTVTPPKSELVARETVSAALVHQDPFNNYGKISLILDRATKLPIYKKIEARNGTVLARSMAALGAVTSQATLLPSWIYAQRGEHLNSLLEYERITLCTENQFQLDPAELDPIKLEGAATPPSQ